MRRAFYLASLSLCLSIGSFAPAQTCVRTDMLVQGGNATTGGINKYDTVVGTFTPSTGGTTYGFRWNNGVLNTYQFSGLETEFAGNNDKGQIVGMYWKLNGSIPNQHGLLFENGRFTEIAYPGAAQTKLTGINNAGDMVGNYVDSSGNSHAFVKQGSTWTVLQPPYADYTVATAISNRGEVLGEYGNAGGYFGFRYKNGVYTTVGPHPGATFTWTTAINKYGTIVGRYEKGSTYAYTLKNGTYYFYDYPAPKGSSPLTMFTGVNDLGDRVGTANFVSGATQGFVLKCR